MTEPENIQAAWSLALSLPAEGALRAIHFNGSSDTIWAAVNADGQFGVLIGMRPDESIASLIRVVGDSAVALRAEHFPFTDKQRDVRAVLITCSQPELRDAFAAFCTLLVNRCQENEPKDKAFIYCLAEFKRLVSERDAGGSTAVLTGLVGELLSLSELVKVSAIAPSFWAFPELARHDFRNGDAALEIKTSLRSRQSKASITVSSIDQLEPPETGCLFLTWYLLESDPKGSLSIDRLAACIVERLDDDAAGAFRAKITRLSLDSESRARTFTLLERRDYRVENTFPSLRPSRLKTEALDAGVSRVTYEIDLSVAEVFRCAPDAPLSALASGTAAS